MAAPSRLFIIAASVAAPLSSPANGGLKLATSDAAVTISDGDKVVLQYHRTEVPPPPGADAVYRRGAFIHPLRTPAGGVVTGIHPDDHIHHVGLWHAWVNTEHGGRKPDFWNLKKKTGTVRHARLLATKDTPAVKGFTALQEHVSLDDGDDPVVVLQEVLDIRFERRGETYLIDYTTRQKNVTEATLKLPAYRYGGPIAYRGPAHWDKDNSVVLTSEGKGREDGHTTRGKWCAFAGPTDAGPAVLAILCHPENHDFPQRMRIWPPDSHNGAVFFNYVPVQEHAWQIAPGETAVMRYRIVAADGGLDADKLDELWAEYSKS